MQQLCKILFPIGNPGKILNKKALQRGNLICYILETEGRRNLRFGEISLQLCQTLLRE